jgi:hypothetical protein
LFDLFKSTTDLTSYKMQFFKLCTDVTERTENVSYYLVVIYTYLLASGGQGILFCTVGISGISIVSIYPGRDRAGSLDARDDVFFW